jgi:ABC-type uncharacterized transport system permease subunit
LIGDVFGRRAFLIGLDLCVCERVRPNSLISWDLGCELLRSLFVEVFGLLLFFVVAAILIAIVRDVDWAVLCDLLFDSFHVVAGIKEFSLGAITVVCLVVG